MARIFLKYLLLFVLLETSGKSEMPSFADAKMLAERGHVAEQFLLGVMYANGVGTPKDYAQSAKWYRKAAEQGFAKAQFNLGVIYADGIGVPRDLAEALKWYRKAAEQGDEEAQYNLARMYHEGNGVTEDSAEASIWYRKAAEQGFAKAQYNLGVMYSNGIGVPRDLAEALKWYRKAAEQGDAQAFNNLGVMYASGNGVPKDLEEAAMWYRKGAVIGNASAQLNLGASYAKGEGVPTDLVQAYSWFSVSGANGNEIAKKYLLIAEKLMTPAQINEAKKLAQKPLSEQSERVGELSERRAAILKSVIAVGGFIDRETHAEFWAKESNVPQSMIAFIMEGVGLAHEYQVQVWKSAAVSNREKTAIFTEELLQLEKAYELWAIRKAPFGKESFDYKVFLVTFYDTFNPSKERTREIIRAAATHSTIKTFQGVTVLVDEAYISAIQAGLSESYMRLKKLVSPEWID